MKQTNYWVHHKAHHAVKRRKKIEKKNKQIKEIQVILIKK